MNFSRLLFSLLLIAASVSAETHSDRYSVSVTSLKVPSEAKKEYRNGCSAIEKQDWRKAADHFSKAVEIYPRYAEAYNNLGAAYVHLGDPQKGREAFQHALEADDHFAAALVNIAQTEIAEHNFGSAESHLVRAVSADPTSMTTLTLLSNVQLLAQHYDDAIATSRKAHLMPHENALVHYVAARALLHKSRVAEAVDECKLFLQEEPTGPRAEAVRREMLQLSDISAALHSEGLQSDFRRSIRPF
ncbi:MAG: tetratricopeptide repeat protein [Acidobacteriales bacterium]|nr:tetratricopeptide repeat protein [Terriglobales bacterium]